MKTINVARIAPLLIVPILGLGVALINACASDTTEDDGGSSSSDLSKKGTRSSYSDDSDDNYSSYR